MKSLLLAAAVLTMAVPVASAATRESAEAAVVASDSDAVSKIRPRGVVSEDTIDKRRISANGPSMDGVAVGLIKRPRLDDADLIKRPRLDDTGLIKRPRISFNGPSMDGVAVSLIKRPRLDDADLIKRPRLDETSLIKRPRIVSDSVILRAPRR